MGLIRKISSVYDTELPMIKAYWICISNIFEAKDYKIFIFFCNSKAEKAMDNFY